MIDRTPEQQWQDGDLEWWGISGDNLRHTWYCKHCYQKWSSQDEPNHISGCPLQTVAIMEDKDE